MIESKKQRIKKFEDRERKKKKERKKGRKRKQYGNKWKKEVR